MIRSSLLVLALVAVVQVGAPAFGADDVPSVSGRYGTAVDWYDDEDDARRVARKTGKLHMAIHISGKFEDPGLT